MGHAENAGALAAPSPGSPQMGWPGPLLSSQGACRGELGYHRAPGTTTHPAPLLCLAQLFSPGRGQRRHSHDRISFRAPFRTRSGLAATLACQAYVLRPTLYIVICPYGVGRRHPRASLCPSAGFLWEAPFPGVSAHTLRPQTWQRQVPTGVGRGKCTTLISSVLATHLPPLAS